VAPRPTRAIINPAPNQGAFYGPVTFTQPVAASPISPPFLVPYPQNPLFTGCDAELQQLADLLGPNALVAITPASAGLGCIGKTQLAIECAHCYGQFFQGGVFWCKRADGVPAEIAAC